MGLLGTLVKGGVNIHQKLNIDLKSPQKQQTQQLDKLLKTAKDTSFGKYYGFTEILQEEDIIHSFKQAVPIHDYNKMHNEWWHQQQKMPDITWPGKPDFFAMSSGTTGKSSKRIPITEDFLKSIRSVGASLVKSLPNYNLPKELFESEILMLTSTVDLDEHKQGHLEGEISGINVNNFPGWYDLFYRPGKEIASINDWDRRVEEIAKKAPEWNIGAVAGITSWVLLMLKKIIETHNLNNIHEIWPNFVAYASGGVAFDTYRKDFEAISGKPITIIDTYLASEGFFAHSGRPETMAMQLALSHGYFYEFIPFDERGVDERGEIIDNPVSHNLDEVELHKDYVLVVSSCAGAWRYLIGDTIKFTSLNPHEIKITGRTKFFLNVVGSQLSEEKMDAAIVSCGKEFDCNINEYMVAAVKDEQGDYIHQWIIVTDNDFDKAEFTKNLDEALQNANKNYRVARAKALKGITINKISKAQYHDYLEKSKKKGGQVKTPKVMDEEKMKELFQFLKS
ncbi:MAG: GH3 family domain-containing protein [Candidatus Cyclobacteriaceae bacterium M2_1C_046]